MVQEAHLALIEYERNNTIRNADSLLRRIVINLTINHFHRELSAPFVFENIVRTDRLGMLVDASPSPERTLAAEQELDWVVNLLSAVSSRTCQMFIAQRGGYSYEEVATAFAIKQRTVEKHVTAAKRMLHEIKHDRRIGVLPPQVKMNDTRADGYLNRLRRRSTSGGIDPKFSGKAS